MKIENSSPKRLIFIIMAIIFVFVFLMVIVVNTTHALRSPLQAMTILHRIDSELLENTPAGKYYKNMYWHNNDEFWKIYIEQYPGRFLVITYPRVELFIDGLESLLNARGDEVKITAEQISGLQKELDWLLTVCNPSLCDDILREEKRFPLQIFIGMTYREAWDYINVQWEANIKE
jgi:hypothetical protein